MKHMVQNKDNMNFEIILVLLKAKIHLRDIARILNASHSTISRRLRTIVEENILDYKVQGKNKVFFIKNNLKAKNYVFNAERYKLIKLLKKYPELDVILSDILKKVDSKLIILFGSYAKFSAKKQSDIDIYIETKNKEIKKEIEFTNSKINVKIGKFDKDSLLIKEIIKNHIILKGVGEFYEKTEFFK